MLPTTRQEALTKGLPHYFKGNVCTHGHVAKYRAKKGSCTMCDKMHNNVKNRMTQSEAVKRNIAVYWPTKKCKANGHFSQRRSDKNQCLACDKQSNHERRARMLEAIPPWADMKKIKGLYEHTPGYALDHIVPLIGKNVCGLHCVDNLAKIPNNINASKSNKWYNGMDKELLDAGLDPIIVAYMRLDEAWGKKNS